MTIETLIDAPDASERVRDAIGSILVLESAAQRALALAQSLDPAPWKLRVFIERSNAWSEFVDVAEAMDTTPIVCVSWDGSDFDRGAGSVVSGTTASATYNVDVYGVGVSAATAEGHDPGDAAAAIEAARAARLVRQILMSAHCTYLGLRGVVGRRWVESLTPYRPGLGDVAIEQVAAVRLRMRVEMVETSPQHVGAPLEMVSVGLHRDPTGEVLIAPKP